MIVLMVWHIPFRERVVYKWWLMKGFSSSFPCFILARVRNWPYDVWRVMILEMKDVILTMVGEYFYIYLYIVLSGIRKWRRNAWGLVWLFQRMPATSSWVEFQLKQFQLKSTSFPNQWKRPQHQQCYVQNNPFSQP